MRVFSLIRSCSVIDGKDNDEDDDDDDDNNNNSDSKDIKSEPKFVTSIF